MTRRYQLLAAAALAAAASALPSAQSSTPPSSALEPIVGVWQSEATDGPEVRSSCSWTPQHLAVVCDQTIVAPDGTHHAVNLFTANDNGGYTLYVMTQPGAALRPVPLTIDGTLWTYGGTAPDQNGVTRRTINDFSPAGAYLWRTESSRDGEHWTTLAHGRNRRVAQP
jgi:hypothetical protein